MNISPSSSSPGSPGDVFSLTCLVTFSDNSLPSDVPSPTFRWYFGTNDNASIPSGVTPMATVLRNNTYTSILQFSPLRQSHTGMYTCRIVAGRLIKFKSFVVAVNGTLLM